MSEPAIILQIVTWFGVAVLSGVAIVNIVTVAAAGRAVRRAVRRRVASEDDAAMASPLTPPITIIVARSGPMVAERVRRLLDLRYPELEVIVVDAVREGTLGRLRAEFALVDIPAVVPRLVTTPARVVSTAVSRDGTRLLVVEVEGQPSYADLLNAGVNFARARLLCALRPGLTLADDALLRLARPFMDNPRDAEAAVAIARPLNGCTVRQGRVIATGWPTSGLARVRLVEQLRGSVVAQAVRPRRRSRADAGGMLLVRRDHVIELGGFRARAGGENADLLGRLQRRGDRIEHRVRFVAVPNPICWREVRETWAGTAEAHRTAGYATARVLDAESRRDQGPGRLRRWWQTAVFLIPLVQLVTGLAAAAGVLLGHVDPWLGALLLTVGLFVPATLSIAALTIEELAFPRRGGLRALAGMIAAAVVVPAGYQQVAEWWRLRGLLAPAPPVPAAPVVTTERGVERVDPGTRPTIGGRGPATLRRRRAARRGSRGKTGR
ncbi:MAG: hypothetical protein ACRD29_03675 [Acidimicrobiales bacterium]